MLKLARILLYAVGTAVLSSCATPPGRIPDSDFLSRSVVIHASVPQTIISFQEGFRQCGFEGPGVVFVVHYGEPVCSPVRADGTAVCDVYIRLFGGRSARVHGRVDLSPINGGTNAVLRVLSPANRQAILDAWEKFLCWSPQSSCPSS